MIEFFLGLVTLPTLIGVVFIALMFESFSRTKVAAFLAVIAIAMAYMIFQFNPWYLLAYPVIGIVWSVWRWRAHVATKVKEIYLSGDKRLIKDLDDYLDEGKYSHMIEAVVPRCNLGLLSAWVIVWPVSMVANVVGDTVRGIQSFLINQLGGVFNNITRSQIRKHRK